ncbi:hypothetical protein GCM10028806_33380 [Spirosoma terrae]|uniref:SF4 helicase domain-containing protein n=1 Tax=Spirosoma terrae TaxID=1968276 RepID=A0A6L9LA24_9BACT|nr:hypothetical protein [Spirosoma terrae]NDU95653.1 hypothetical protein [Spirosoma terrae]
MDFRDAMLSIKARIDIEDTSLPISLPRFNEFLGGISDEEMYLLFGATGTSKTKLAIKLFVLDLLNQYLENPDNDFHVIYATLELSATEIYYNIFCNALHRQTGNNYSIKFFKNKIQDDPLTNDRYEEFKLIMPWLKKLDKKVTIIDHIKQPSKLYQYIRWKLNNEWGTVDETSNKYVKHNPRKKIIIITDTINALQKDTEDADEYTSIKRWSNYYCKQLLKMFYKCSIINIQQSDKQSTTVQYTGKGERIEDKFIPRVENLSTVKTTPDDHTTVISIYNPSRYGVSECEGYKVGPLGNHFRYLNVLKNSHGDENKGVGIYIDNAHLEAVELPRPDQIDNLCGTLSLLGIDYLSRPGGFGF